MPGSAGGWFDYMDPQAHEPPSADPGIGKAERRPSDVGLPDGRAFIARGRGQETSRYLALNIGPVIRR